ncbi:MAG TPA: K(+)-transporting ATPase subunit C [Chloroflexota bacterium]|nr:K(+)-transporting ATPase subunit C [Chloroflexota bacterium]
MELVRQTRSAVLMVVVLTVLVGIIYPLVMTGLAPLIFPYQANGSLMRDAKGNVIGSESIGQQFSDARYFHPRPSVAGDEGYDATASGGTNLGPTNKKLIDSVQERAVAYRQENGLAPDAQVPVDAVTASASGLDPEISPANAQLQVKRVAAARSLPEDQVRALVDKYTRGRTLGILGDPGNVLLAGNACQFLCHI